MPNPLDLCKCGHFFSLHFSKSITLPHMCFHEVGSVFCRCYNFVPISVHTEGYPGYVDHFPVDDEHKQIRLFERSEICKPFW